MSGVEVVSVSDFYERLFERVSIEELQESWLIKNLPRVVRRNRALRQIAESVLAGGLLIIFSPILVLAGALIKLTSKGGVFYCQLRVGQNEEEFLLYKFRSMYGQKELNPDADASTPTWSGAGDERVTRIGGFLRASHIDEFPQLFNILRGEMSFVDPGRSGRNLTPSCASRSPTMNYAFY